MNSINSSSYYGISSNGVDNLTKCKYQKSYFNYESNKNDSFVCDEDSLDSGYCIFHDEKYAINQQNKSFVRDRLYSKINESVSNKRDLLCIGYFIPDTGISNKFSGNIYFIDANFMGDITFKDSEFFANVDFSYSKFLTEGNILFSSSKFSGNIVTFEGTEFLKSVPHFNGMKVNVKESINFACKYHKGADFSSSEFSARKIQFSRAEFYGSVHLNETKFFDFENLYFNGIKTFKLDDRKSGNVNFIKSKFGGEGFIDFSESEFNTPFTFSRVECSIKGSVDFTKTKFHQAASFMYSKFASEVKFEGCQFNSNSYFNFTLFDYPERVFFRTANLSKVSFVNTDVSRLFLAENVSFNLSRDKFKTVDERNFEKNIRSNKNLNYPTLGSVLTLYRNLRENFEFNMRYEDAGQCFFREMELKRMYNEDNNGKAQINNRFKRNLFSITAIYKLISKYGESLRRPTVAGLIVFSIAMLFWLMQSNSLTMEPSLFDVSGLYRLANHTHTSAAIERSFTDFIPFIQPQIKNLSFPDYATKIMGTIILGLALIALRRKFERRFRH